jgi:Skp family chaperone for outer membrane proteins
MLQQRVWSAALALTLSCGLAGLGAAVAQQPKAPVTVPAPPKAAPPPPAPAALPASDHLAVLVVDVQALLQESKAAKMVRVQIEEKRAEYTKEISHEEENLRAARDALQRQQASLSAEAMNKKGREFQQKVNELDRSVQAKRQALEKSNSDAMSKIQQEIMKIISDIIKQRKANLVFLRQALVLYDQSFDVTDEVMQKLDEKMPVMTVNFVNPQPPPAALASPPPAGGAPVSPGAAKPRRK